VPDGRLGIDLQVERGEDLSRPFDQRPAIDNRQRADPERLAAEGMSGPGSAFEGRNGLWEKVTGPFDLAPFPDEGGVYLTPRVQLKYWPIETNGQAAVWAALELRAKTKADELREIEVFTSKFTWFEIGSEPEKWDPKTRETAERIAPEIRRAVDAAHGGWPAANIRPMSAYVADSIGDTRFILFVLAAFAGASVLLAAVGLYGTLAYLTAQRTREFGIRLALGSSVRAIIAIVMREGVLLAVAGAALGLVGVAAVTGAIRELLYGPEHTVGDRAIDVVVNRLRKKLVSVGGPDAEHLIKTEFRRGYLLVSDVATLPHEASVRARAVLEPAS